jgi:hypothetical protein
MILISPLFTGKEARLEARILEKTLDAMRDLSRDDTYHELCEKYPEERVRHVRELFTSDMQRGEEYFSEYLMQKVIPRVKKTIDPKGTESIELMPSLRVDYVCDECDPMRRRREFPDEKSYVLERDAFDNLRKGRSHSLYYQYCERHGKQKTVSISTSFDAPFHLKEYKLFSIRGGMKSGESFMFKLVDRLSSEMPEPIWDLYRFKVITLTPHDAFCRENGITEYSLFVLNNIYQDLMYTMDNPHREVFNAGIRRAVVAERKAQGITDARALEDELEKNWLVPRSDHRLFQDEHIYSGSEGMFMREQVFDACRVLAEGHLLNWETEKMNYEGDLQHHLYEKRKAEDAIIEWEEFQRGAFKFFWVTDFFERTPLVSPYSRGRTRPGNI